MGNRKVQALHGASIDGHVKGGGDTKDFKFKGGHSDHSATETASDRQWSLYYGYLDTVVALRRRSGTALGSVHWPPAMLGCGG